MKSALAAVSLLGCVIVFSSQPVTGAEPNPKNTLQQARTDVRAHRLQDAVAAYEKVVADSSRDAAKYKADAWYELLLLRVSADPAVRDLSRGAAAIDGLRAYPAHPRAQEIAALGSLLQEADRRAADEQRAGDKRVAEATAKMTAALTRTTELEAQLASAKQSDESVKLRQEATGLRAENKTLRDETRNLRDQLAKAQAELQKKDEALKRIAGSLIKSR